MKKSQESKLKFSICMPVYNGERIVEPTIRSILSQSFKNFELIIVDDFSKDKSSEVIRKIIDKRIKYFQNEKNLGYSGNLENCRQKATGDIIYLMGQDDIMANDTLLNTYLAFASNDDVGAVTRPYYWFDEDINTPVRIKKQLNPDKNEIITINDDPQKIIKMFETLDQLSGLAYRKKYMDLPFHEDIFPCHVYPFASIFKKHPVVFLRDYNLAVRISTSQTRSLSSIYEKSPTKSWKEMFDNVFPEEKHQKIKSDLIKNFVAANYVGLIQLRNYAKFKYFLREIFYLLKYRWQNIYNLKFWFFSLGCLVMPPILLIPLVDWYKNKINTRNFNKIKFNFSLYDNSLVSEPKISVVIPTYNRKKDLIENIRSIKKSTYRNLEIIIIDNASTDGTVDVIRKVFTDVKIFRSKTNLDAAGGRNIGIKLVDKKSDYILFFDDDFVIERNTIAKLYQAISDNEGYGAATGKILYYENPSIVQIAGSSVSLYTGLNYANHGPDDGRFDKPCDCFAGGSMLIKKSVVMKVGFYDEIYPRPYEDADYSVRIIKAGYKIRYVPEARIFHKAPIYGEEAAANRWLTGAYSTARNKIIFMRKHSPCFYCFTLLYIVYFIYYTCQAVRFKRTEALVNFYKGARDGFRWAFLEYDKKDTKQHN